MTQDGYQHRHEFSYNEGLITALAVGGFFIILGVVFGLIPGVWQATNAFFKDITATQYQYGSTTISLPAPANPAAHADFYSAVMYFCLGIGVLQIIILALRLMVHSRFRRVSETVGNLIFWFGAAVCVDLFLLAATLTGWFQFWSALILVIGISVIIRALLHLARRKNWSTRKDEPV